MRKYIRKISRTMANILKETIENVVILWLLKDSLAF